MTEKIAITLDAELLRQVESLRRRTGESRSAVITRAVAAMLSAREHRQRVEDYVAAYRRVPESRADVVAAERLARESLADVSWEDR